ncbi:MAG: universal stress protein UspA related nucleotide-binding protein [halophilic archaeon J07HX64]|jgi:Universal stress protein UspA and related nucleotide-binding proteins|nr:MAG: universal stress protein UspA related nucleotide-binding protein [halophilic archaeon J07HX64]
MTVLVAYDGSDPAREAVEYALEEHSDDEVVLLRVVEVAGGATDAGFELLRDQLDDRRDTVSSEIAEELDDLLDTTDVDVRLETTTGDPANEIVGYADEHDIDHIIVGSYGRGGVSRVLLGSVAETVARRSAIPVTIVR